MIRRVRTRVTRPLQEFLQTETSGGAVLLAATATALLLANLPTRGLYHDLLHHRLTIGLGGAAMTNSLEGWINDGLMTLFFFVAGLEIKRELVEGDLRDRKAAALPVLAAGGGMAVPALIYAVINLGSPTMRGAGIPVATDIAFAVGVVVLLGPRVPSGLKVFLLTLAIADDIGGIIVIAIFYSASLSGPWLAAAVLGLLAAWVMRKAGVASIWPYALVGVGVWYAMHQSGVHATIAGVALGLLTPVEPVNGRRVLHRLEHRLHPWTSYAVIPVFALANAGIEVSRPALSSAFASRVTWGVILGLVVGKTIGVSLVTFGAVRAGVGKLPPGMEPRHVMGMAMLAGVGFTVALFVAGLSFPGQALLLDDAKVGIFVASLAAAALGSLVLVRASARATAESPQVAVVPELAAEAL